MHNRSYIRIRNHFHCDFLSNLITKPHDLNHRMKRSKKQIDLEVRQRFKKRFYADMACKSECAQKMAHKKTKASAGVLLVLEPQAGRPVTLIMHKGATTLSDFGGKGEPMDQSAWQTAVRECTEEAGVTPTAHHGCVELNNKFGNPYTIYVVGIREQTIQRLKHDSWVQRGLECLTNRGNDLHPRLRYASGKSMSALVDICKRAGLPRPAPASCFEGCSITITDN